MEGITTNPRQQFITNLTGCVKEWRKDLDDVMILLDANQDLTPSSVPSLITLMRECQLIDLFHHHHHGIRPTFPTYDLGSKRLDYAIGTATLSPYVIKCGYLPFYLGVSSDHRGLFIDLSTEPIDGLTRLEAIPRRQLNSAFTKDVYKYKQYLEKEFTSHNIYQKAEDLYTMADLINKADDPIYQQRLADLDKIIVNIQLLAESKCCKQRSPFDFSEDIHYTKVIINYWNIKRKEFTRNRSVTTITDNIYNQLPLEHQQFIDSATGYAFTNWIKSKRRLRAMMALLKQNRSQEKQALIDNEAAYKGVPTDQVMKKNLRRQQDKKLFNTRRSHFHPNDLSGLSHIIIPEADKDGIPTDDVEQANTWRTETSPQTILETIHARNVKHFGQADGTPFSTEPLLQTFGYNGMTYGGTELISSGTLPSYFNELPSPTQDVIQRISDTTKCTSPDNDYLSYETFAMAFKKWRESTFSFCETFRSFQEFTID